MRRRGIAVLLVVALVLGPMWFIALQGEPPGAEIAIDQSVNEIRPLDGFLDTPNKLSPSQVGVIVWIALFVLLGVLAFFHRFMNRAARPERKAASPDGDAGSATEPAADGGSTARGPGTTSDPQSGGGSAAEPRSDGGTATFPWLETDDRWIVEYVPSTDAIEGLIAMGGLTVLTITFAALFTGEYLTLARTQYFGIYGFGMFMSLTGLTVSYYAWFMPHVEVAERRGHS